MRGLGLLKLGAIAFSLSFGAAMAQPVAPHDGAHDFDFLIGDWKAHVRRLPERLTGSTAWVDYDGISNHQKLFGSNSNLEEFEVDSPDKKLHLKAQTLRLYNPVSRQWSIYLVDVDNGTLGLPPVIGQFTGKRGEFFDQEEYRGGRSSYVTSGSTCRRTRRGWSNPSPPTAARPGR